MDLIVRFVSITCCVSSCGITWAVPETYDNEKIENHTNFYCPNGHQQHYVVKSDLEIARHELGQTKKELFKVKNCAQHKKYQITALKGVITRIKKKESK